MSKARDLANLISTGNALSDGAISVSEISDLTASAAELNKLDGVTATTAELNQVVGATSALQTQLDNISVTSGSLTKTFVQNETADITLSQSITSAPVVSATKEVPQTGISTKGNWDVNSTASNYDFHNTAPNVTLTHSQVANTSISLTQVGSDLNITTYGPRPSPFFKSDGTKMYICSETNSYIYQYSLSTAWDLSTATWDGSSSSLTSTGAAGETDPTDVVFKPDGTVLWIVGNYNNNIRSYSLSTAWDLSTASLNSGNKLNVASQETAPRGLRFKSDGTVAYVVGGNGNATFIYTLSTAWDLDTATYSTSFASASQDNGPHGIEFNSTGTRMYLLGGSSGNGKLFQYNLSTAWDLSTASYANVFADFTGITSGTSPQGIFIDSSETRVYFGCGGSGTGKMYQFSNGSDALALGSGSFASTDVGKRIVGNGGDVILTSTGGAFSTTGGSAFTDSSTIAAGSWSMFGLKSAGDADGITMSGLVVGGDVSAMTQDSAEYNYSQESTSGLDVAFKPDGTQMYVVSHNDSEVKQFGLSTAWDITTASYTRAYSYSTASYGNQLSAVTFKPDGTIMYMLNWGYDYLMQVPLSTAWDLSTANLQYVKDVTGSTWGSVNNPVGLAFSPDGTKLFMAGQSHKVVQINLSVAWDIHNATKTVAHTFSTTSQFNTPSGMALNSTGTKLYLGNTSDAIWQYSLGTAYDLSTISYDNKTKSLVSNAGQYGFTLKSDDTKFYQTSYNQHKIYQWTLASFQQPTQQYHVAVTNSGGQIDSSSFIDINSMTAAQSAGSGTVHYAVSTDGRTTWSVAKGTDGVRPIVRNNSGTWQYNNDAGTISTSNYNLNNASYDNKSFVTSNESGSPREVHFNTNGTKMYVLSDQTDKIWEYDLSTAFDVSTASYNSSQFSVSSQLGGAQGFCFNNNGTKVYVVGENNDTVYQYSLSTAFDITTASYDSVSFGIGGQQGIAGTIVFNGDGTKMFLCGESEDYVRQYTLSTAFNVGTASVASGYLDHSSQSTMVTGMAFNGDGTKLFLASRNNEEVVYQYGLTTAYDVSTASYDNVSFNLDQSSQFSASLQGIVFSNDGSKLYAMDNSGKVLQYSTGGTLSSYATSATWVNGTVNDELYTLQQALGAQAFNRMDKTQLDAIPDANHFSTGSSLDLMIALRMDTAASTLPTSDGVTLNYDAAALNEGAVLGTDYDFFFPANNKVQIKSLAAQNLKVRVV